MALVRFLGWLLILTAFSAAGYDAYQWHYHDQHHVTAAGKLWYDVSPGTLDLFRAGVQRHIAPALWDLVIRPVSLWPAFAVLGVPGILLVFLARRRHPGRSPRRFAK
jgi:hypothetical protein